MITDLTVSVVPGDGVVIRNGDVIVSCPAVGAADANALGRIIEAVDAASSAADPAETLHDQLLAAAEAGPLPGLGAVIALEPVTVIVIGDADIHVTGPGSETHLHGRNSPEPIVRTVTEPIQSVVVGTATDPMDRPWLDFGDGVVPGAGVTVRISMQSAAAVAAPPATPRPADPAEPPAPPESAPPAPFESVSFTGSFDLPATVATPLPVEEESSAEGESPVSQDEPSGIQVQGLRCRRGHFNHPQAANCAWCGLAMVQDSYILVNDTRPPLGVLVVNDQATFTLDTDYLIGRSPGRDASVQSEEYRALSLADPDRSVSRVHAAVMLDGWEVQVIDRGSANGTWVIDKGAANWERLQPDAPRTLRPGGHVQIGPHRLTFHSHHVR